MRRSASLFTDLGGHCMETLVEAFDAAQDDVPTLFIAWTIKGFGLPFAGHKDNHAGLMNPTQLAALREAMGVREGEEWEPLEGVGDNARPGVEALIERSAHRSREARRELRHGQRSPPFPPRPAKSNRRRPRSAASCSTCPRPGGELADRIVTTSPDVTVSTNLGAWVNQRGLFRRSEMPDVFAKAKIASAQKWSGSNKGQHIELGIAESNLFLMLAAAGLSGDLFGERLFPIGTLYDPFIARGLDALNYACYQDARFLLVATPSGITLGPEGGAHQSINPPLIALGQPGLRHYEPAFADELAAMMEEAFRLIDDPAGESTYLRLSTRSIQQVERTDDELARRRASRRLLASRRPARTPKRRSSPWARSCPKRSPRGRNCATTSPASACSPSPRPTCSTAAGPPRRQRAGQANASRATSNSCCPARSRRARPCHHRRRRTGLTVLARRSARPARRAARRREIRPDRQPRRPLRCVPARRRPRSPKPLPSSCCLPRGRSMAGRYFDEWQVGDRVAACDHAHRDRDRQRPDHDAHPQSAAAAPRL